MSDLSPEVADDVLDSPTTLARMTIRQLFSDAVREIIGLESPFFRTARGLTRNPGRFVWNYLERDRAGLTNPVKYALLTATLLVVLGQARRLLFPQEVDQALGEMRVQATELAHDLRAYLLLLALVPATLVQWLLFRRSRANYAETYAFNAFVFGHLIFIPIILGLALPLLLGTLAVLKVSEPLLTAISMTGMVAYFGGSLAYYLWAVRGFYEDGRFSVYFRGIVVFSSCSFGLLVVMNLVIQWALGR